MDIAAGLRNPVVALGFQVVLGALTVQEAVNSATREQQLSSISDAELGEVLDVVGAWARDREQSAVAATTSWVYHHLRTECAKERLRRIGQLRGAEPGDQADQRMAAWISRTAGYVVQLGLASILLPELRVSFDILSQAEFMARQPPDLGSPRYGEIAAALAGQVEVAHAAGQHQLAAQAKQRMSKLMTDASLPSPVQTEINGIGAEFKRMWTAREQLFSGDYAEGADRPMDPVQAAIQYQRALHKLAAEAASGKMTLEAAAGQLVADAALEPVPAGLLQWVCDGVLGLADRAPDRAVGIARLHRLTAERVGGPHGPLSVALASLALGRALLATQLARSRPELEQPVLLSAVAEFAHCVPVLEADDESVQKSAAATMWLSMAYERVGWIDKGLAAGRESVRRHAALPPSQLVLARLANSRALVGSLLAQSGDKEAALDTYIQAHQGFVAVSDMIGVREALGAMWSLAESLGRGDEAVEAAEQALGLFEQSADLVGAAQQCLRIATLTFRYGELRPAAAALSRAERLVFKVPEKPESRDKRWYDLVSGIFLMQAVVLLTQIDPGDDKTSAEFLGTIRQLAEYSRRAALQSGSDGPLSRALLVAARVELAAGNFTLAADRLNMLDLVRVPAGLQPEIAALAGIMDLNGHPEVALQKFQRAFDGYQADGRLDKAAVALVGLGKASERVGADAGAVAAYERADELLEQLRGLLAADISRIGLRGSFGELYDRLVLLHAQVGGGGAWYWIERAKGRALVELLGLRPLPVPPGADTPELRDLLDQETDLLAVVSSARLGQPTALIAELDSETGGFSSSRKAVMAYAQLRQLWAQMSASLPDYVALRTAEVPAWQTIQPCLTVTQVTTC